MQVTPAPATEHAARSGGCASQRPARRADALRLDPRRRRPRVGARRPADRARPAARDLLDPAARPRVRRGRRSVVAADRRRAERARRRGLVRHPRAEPGDALSPLGLPRAQPTCRRSSTPIRRRPRRSPRPSSRSSSPTWTRRRCSTTSRSCADWPGLPTADREGELIAGGLGAQARDAARPPRPARRRPQRAGGGVPRRLHRAHGAPADRRRAGRRRQADRRRRGAPRARFPAHRPDHERDLRRLVRRPRRRGRRGHDAQRPP